MDRLCKTFYHHRLQGKKKVLLADSDCASLEQLASCLANEGFLVATAQTVRCTNEVSKLWTPDIIIMDVELPGRNSAPCHGEADTKGGIPTVLSGPRHLVAELALHPAGRRPAYLAKPYSSDEVIDCINKVLRETPLARQSALLCGCLKLDSASESITIMHGVHPEVDMEPADLTTIEFNILSFLALNPNRAFTRAEIMSGSGMEVGLRSVDTHIHNIRRKFRQRGIGGFVVTVRGRGYRLY